MEEPEQEDAYWDVVRRNQVLSVQRFLREGLVDVNISSGNREETALHLASSRGYIQMSRILLEHGADVNVQDTDGRASIHLADREDHVGVVLLQVEEGEADPNIGDVDG